MSERMTYVPPEATGQTIEGEEAVAKAIGSKEWSHFTPEFVGTKAQTLNTQAVQLQIELAIRNFQEARISQPEGRVKLKTDLPFSICHLGDLHYGSIYANMDEIERKWEVIKKTPNMYVVFMANLIDNAIPTQFPDNMLSNAIPPDKQVIMMRKMVKELDEAGKVLGAVTSPCHEGWTFKKTGQDINALIFGYPERRFPVLENGGRLHVECSGYTYMGALYHQVGPFESNFNETHALRQLNRLNLQMSADWVAGAHRHFAAAETVYEGTGQDHLKTVAYVRTGSEKGTGEVRDQWSVGRYGATGEPSGQTVHFWPNERRLMTNLDFDTAVLAQESIYLTAMARRDGTK